MSPGHMKSNHILKMFSDVKIGNFVEQAVKYCSLRLVEMLRWHNLRTPLRCRDVLIEPDVFKLDEMGYSVFTQSLARFYRSNVVHTG